MPLFKYKMNTGESFSLGFSGRGVKLTTHLHLVPKLRMRAVIPLFPHTLPVISFTMNIKSLLLNMKCIRGLQVSFKHSSISLQRGRQVFIQ